MALMADEVHRKVLQVTGNDILFDLTSISQRIRTGQEEIERLGAHLDALDARKVLVVCGPNVLNKSDVVARVEAALGGRLAGRFAEAKPHTPIAALMAAHEVCQRLGPDTVLSIGGGSTMAIAKGVALLDATSDELSSYAMRFEPPDHVVMPASFPRIRLKVVSVPTTIGCAELGLHVGGFTTEGDIEKMVIAGDGQTGPHLVVIDGMALSTTPAEVQRATAVGQLRIAIESFVSTRHHPFGDALSLHSARLLVGELQEPWAHTPDQLLRIKIAAALASLARVQGYGACSAVAHQLGSICGVGHGEANATMLAHVVRWNAGSISSRIPALSEALGVPMPVNGEGAEEQGNRIADFLTELNAKLDLPTRLRDLDIPRASLGAVASAALRDMSLYTNPRPMTTVEDVTALIESAW